MIALRIAWRYLFSKKSHNAVNIISMISVGGVAVATAAIVCVLSVFNGFSRLASSRLSFVDPDLKVIHSSGRVIAGADSLSKTLSDLPQISSALPVLEEQALAIYAGRQMPVNIKGVPDEYRSVIDIDSVVIDGAWLNSDGDYSCATLSVGAAMRLEARPGYIDCLALYVPRRIGRINPAAMTRAFRSDSLLISGVYQTNQTEFDNDMLYMPLSGARRLLDYTSEASAIELKTVSGVSASKARKAVEATLGPGYKVLDRMQQQEESFRMIEIEKWITFLMLTFILVIASFNIISTMSMLIIEKEPNIATLGALGASEGMIARIFLYEGWFISLLGGVIGIGVGLVLCLAQQYGGIIRLNGDPSQLSVTVYPVHVEWMDVAITMALVAAIGFLIGLVAARIITSRLRRSS